MHAALKDKERAAVGKSRTPVAFWHSPFAKVLLNKLSTLLLALLLN